MADTKHAVGVVQDSADPEIGILQPTYANIASHLLLTNRNGGDLVTGNVATLSTANTESALQAASTGPYRPALVIPEDIDFEGYGATKTVPDVTAGWMFKPGSFVPEAAVDGEVARGEYLTYSTTAKKFSGTNAFIRRPLTAQAIALASTAIAGNIPVLLLSPSPQICRRARIYNNADLVLAGDGIITFNTEDYDTHGMHEGVTNPSRFTIPAGAISAMYHISGHLTWSASATHWLFIRLNGVTWIAGNLTADASLGRQINTSHVLSAGDFVELYVVTGAATVKYYAKYSPVFSIIQTGE